MICKAYHIVKILLAMILFILFLWIHWLGTDCPSIAAETVYDPCSISGQCNSGTIICAYIIIGSITIHAISVCSLNSLGKVAIIHFQRNRSASSG